MPSLHPVSQLCLVCGAEFAGSPSMVRHLARSKGDPNAPGLCWVCRRLHYTVALETKQMRAAFAPMDYPEESALAE